MIAFGYVRVAKSDDPALDTLHDLIKKFGDREGYTVEAVYADHGTPDSSLVRPGFQQLAEELRRQEGVAHVLVPDLGHLSPLPAVRTALTAQIGALGSTVVQCEPAVSGPPAP